MKNWKHFMFMAIIAIFGLVTVFIACDNNNGNKKCECTPKEHLGIGETCTCGADDCTACTVKVYGTLGDAANTPIYRSGDVSDEQMDAAVANARDGYSTLILKDELVGKIAAIHITGDGEVNYSFKIINGQHILEVRYDRPSATYENRLYEIANDTAVFSE
jgi:hypothetical protein